MRGTLQNRPQTIYDWGDEHALTDVLYKKAFRPQKCEKKCMGSAMDHMGEGSNKPMSLEKKLTQAEEFLADYYQDGEHHDQPMVGEEERREEVKQELEAKGYYKLTKDELVWGARTAWRNAPRCPARVIWKKLIVFDCRQLTDTDMMFMAICRHLEVALNGGNIQPAITIFRERRPGLPDLRVWNKLIIGFAGYEQEDGSIVGDPSGVELTKVAESLGWRGPGGRFDILPWILSGEDGEPKLYYIPQKFLDELPLTVHITHPTIPAIGEMDLHWLSLPGVANMMAEIGGLQFTAAPFAGWYQGTEVASRDFLDVQRYNLMEPLGQAMNLDMSSNTTLWKDVVALELNRAVLESYKNAKISIVDHYTQAEQFMEHMAAEYKTRGGCPADWVWLVPPMSGSLVPTYHQEMLRYNLSPSYEYQEKPWMAYFKRKKRISFKTISWTMLLGKSIFNRLIKQRKKVTILYGTETGQSKRFANQALNLFMSIYRCTLIPLDHENLYENIRSSDINIFISSTFGSGEAPTMAEAFRQELIRLVKDHKAGKEYEITPIPSSPTADWFRNLHFTVFGLGSSAYVDLAAFGTFIDSALGILGGHRLTALGIGDELKNQKASFQTWLTKTFQAAIKLHHIQVSEEKMETILKSMNAVKDYKWDVRHSSKTESVNNALASLHNQEVFDLALLKRSRLHKEPGEPNTLLLDFSFTGSNEDKIPYEAGDHLGLYPSNRAVDVAFLRERLLDLPSLTDPLLLLESTNGRVWREAEDFPKLLLFDDLLNHVVDLSRLPSQDVLRMMLKNASAKKDQEQLKVLVSDPDEYEAWSSKCNSFCDTLREFPSVHLPSAEVMGVVPSIQSRLYSIASASEQDRVSLLVGVVEEGGSKEGRKGSKDELRKGSNEVGPPWKGLCTGQLLSAEIGHKLPAFFRSSSFKLPQDPTKPVIMIAAGSGIAPFRSFWQERLRQAEAGLSLGPMILIFGCRRESMDLLRKETDKLGDDEDGWLTGCLPNRGPRLQFTRLTALSRQERRPAQYVQDIVEENGELVHKLWIEAKGSVYVCGKVAMARGVQERLEAVVAQVGNIGEEKAQARMAECRAEGRYQEDIFTA